MPRRDPLEKIVVDEPDFFQPAMLKIGQGLRHDFVSGEFIDGDAHLWLR